MSQDKERKPHRARTDMKPGEVPEELKELEGEKVLALFSIYRSDQEAELWRLTEEGFEPLAWSRGVRHVLYHPESEFLLVDVEGDLGYYREPSPEEIEAELQQYPKEEVSGYGENFDSRFHNI